MDVDDRPGYLYDHAVAWARENNVNSPDDLHNRLDLRDFVDTLMSIAGVYPEDDL